MRPPHTLLRATSIALVLASCDPPPPDDTPDVEVRDLAEITDIEPGAASLRRLTRAQYVASVQAVFGQDLPVLKPTEIDLRVHGLTSVGARDAQITPAGFEGYEASARSVAAEALSEARRDTLLPCTPASETGPDDACAAQFVSAYGSLVLRRLLTSEEEDAYIALARMTSELLEDFYSGLEAVIVAWLVSPDFLFIQELTQPAASDVQGERLTAVSLASRLSYFFWGRGPDRELLHAAATGQLDDEGGYTAQVDRLLADEAQLTQGVRALFTDLYDLDELSHVDKEREAFPELTPGALEDAREQTLRTIVDHLLVKGADYRDLFTTRETFLTRRLGPIYDVPVSEDWQRHTFPEGRARAGILTHVSFVALNARTARSSPVLRGEFVLDKILCREIPPPPADVNFDGVVPGDANAPTARERLMNHRVDPACSGCHNHIDPIGLAFENFDAIGRFRTQESGEDILTFGDIDGETYDDIRGFHTVLRDTEAVTRCMADKLFMHGAGREPVAEEEELLMALHHAFADAGHAFAPLMKSVALSHGFRVTSGPAEAVTEEAP